MRVMIVGDTHMDVHAIKMVREVIEEDEFGIDAIMVVGDFGYWPDGKKNSYWSRFAKRVADLSVPLYFIRGNHENQDALSKFSDKTKIHEVSGNMFYIPCGHRWTWGETSCGALGGSYSIDRLYRVKNVSWFPEEVVNEYDVKYLGKKRLDVLFTHDCPVGYEPLVPLPIPESVRSRELVSDAVFNTRPRALYHGHWHHSYTRKMPVDVGKTKLISLSNADAGQRNSYVITEF